MKRIIIENNIQAIEQQMAQKDTSNDFSIRLRMLDNNVLFMDIPISSIFERCIQLDLKLKNFNTNQEDFDTFCNQLLKFTVLEQFSFRFYSKRVQNLDSLFAFTQNIKDVNLKLKNFQKIQLSDIVLTSPKTQQLGLSIIKATFKNNSIDNLSHYISQLKELKKLKISINKIKQLPILSHIDNVEVCLNLSHRQIDISFCDELKKIADEKQGIKFSVENAQLIVSSYLYHLGITPIIEYGQLKTSCFNQFQNAYDKNYFYLQQLNKFEYKLLEQTTFLVDFINNLKNKNKITIYLNSQFLRQIFETVIQKIEYQFQKIEFTGQNNYLKKENLYWNASINNVQMRQAMKSLKKCVYLKLTITEYYSENQIKYLSNVLSKYQNLISFQLKQKEKHCDHLKQLEKVIQRKCEAKLRYFAFQKTIYHLIPLPDQLFFDLLID